MRKRDLSSISSCEVHGRQSQGLLTHDLKKKSSIEELCRKGIFRMLTNLIRTVETKFPPFLFPRNF